MVYLDGPSKRPNNTKILPFLLKGQSSEIFNSFFYYKVRPTLTVFFNFSVSSAHFILTFLSRTSGEFILEKVIFLKLFLD